MIADVILLIFISAVAFSCKKKGIIKCVMGLISTVLAVVLALVFRQPLMDALKQNKLYTDIYGSISEKIAERIKVGDTGIINTLAGDAVSKGTEAMTEAAVSALFSIVLFIVLFIVIILVLRVFTNALSSVAKLPVLNFINSACGLIWGAALGAAICYAVFGIWAFFTSYQVPSVLEGSVLSKSMFETNLLLMFFS
jgi:uncharacterized membrane protein required for colicin V production